MRGFYSVSCAFVAVLFLPVASVGELVLLTSGGVLKVASYRADGERAHLELPQGGSISLSMLRVERVLADEVEPPVADPLPQGLGEETSMPVTLDYAADQPIPNVPHGALIYWAAKKHGLNPAVVTEVARAESAFRERAVSIKGAVGVLQLMPATGQRFGLEHSELFDPKKNIEAGTRYLSWLLERFGRELPLALAAYNAGENAVDRYGGIPPYRETQGYVRKILAALGAPGPSQTASVSLSPGAR